MLNGHGNGGIGIVDGDWKLEMEYGKQRNEIKLTGKKWKSKIKIKMEKW